MSRNYKEVIQAYQLLKDDKIILGDEETLALVEGIIKEAVNEYQPCVRITTEDNTTLVCSTTAKIPTETDGLILAPDLLGKKVAVYKNDTTYWSTITSVEDVGNKFVRAMDTGNNSFWAGEVAGEYILHHNMAIYMSQYFVVK